MIQYFGLGHVGTTQTTQARPVSNFVLSETVEKNVQIVGCIVMTNDNVRINFMDFG